MASWKAGAVLLLGMTLPQGRVPAGEALPPGGAPGISRGELTVDGVERSFLLFEPESREARPAVVVVLHGGSGGSGARIRGFVGAELEVLAEAGGFLVAYPDGAHGSWNDCRAGAGYEAKRLGMDDAGFLAALVGYLGEAHDADPDRVYAIGWSNGAHLAYRMALERPGLLHGIAAFGANLPAEGASDCRESGAAMPVFIANGTADVINPFGGGAVVLPDGTPLGRVRSAEETLGYFGRLAGHVGEPEALGGLPVDPGQGTRVEVRGWRSPGRPPVVLYTVHGGGHNIPSPEAEFPAFLGPAERRLGGMEEAVAFFGLHPGRSIWPRQGLEAARRVPRRSSLAAAGRLVRAGFP